MHFLSQFSTLYPGRTPYPWQEQLFNQLLANNFPRLIDLPTGSGKTSVMAIWLLALAARTQQNLPFPRRLVWVVDRRFVVDQVHAEAQQLIQQIKNTELATLLATLSPSKDPLVTGILRGELADTREWSADPARPAIIAGTVDMVGSRLLFSGYGVSWKARSLHAGLLGQDTLIVNDEAHLTPAFAQLLATLSERTGHHRPLQYMHLSATPGDHERPFPETLDKDLDDPNFARRFNAPKTLELLDVPDPLKEIKSLALNSIGRTAVFVRSPKSAREIAKALDGKPVLVITGQMRGKERNAVFLSPLLARLKSPEAETEEPIWIVATSAAEVGMDFSVQNLISDLDTADHLIQRFGRLNRFGVTAGRATIVAAPKQRTDPKLAPTWEYLQTLNADISPRNLRHAPAPPEAREPQPHVPPLLPWHTDAWSLTTIRSFDWPDRPRVEPWLRGAAEESAPETYVAWRTETEDLANPAVLESEVERALAAFPIRSHETLTQYTNELLKALEPFADKRVLVQQDDGAILRDTIENLTRNRNSLAYATLILPPDIGHLDPHGMVDWSAKPVPESEAKTRDVSQTETRSKKRLDGDQREPNWVCIPIPEKSNSETISHHWCYQPEPKSPKTANQQNGSRLLAEHLSETEAVATQFANHLQLQNISPSLPAILIWAAKQHDLGKDRDIWQRVFRNPQKPTEIVAKSHQPFINPRPMQGFRHELASLLDATPKLPSEWSPAEQDLALHLIASHHGRARPHFPANAADRTQINKSRQATALAAQRFARLQREWGPWTLAYLEAVLRSADAIASRGQEDNTPND